MTPLPRTRRDFRIAGQAFARKAEEAFGAAIIGCPDVERTEAFTDVLLESTLTAMEATAAVYLQAGAPPLWVARFRTAFLKAFRDACGRMGQAASAAGRPN